MMAGELEPEEEEKEPEPLEDRTNVVHVNPDTYSPLDALNNNSMPKAEVNIVNKVRKKVET